MTLCRALATIVASALLLASAHAATPRTLVATVERVSDGEMVTVETI